MGDAQRERRDGGNEMGESAKRKGAGETPGEGGKVVEPAKGGKEGRDHGVPKRGGGGDAGRRDARGERGPKGRGPVKKFWETAPMTGRGLPRGPRRRRGA